MLDVSKKVVQVSILKITTDNLFFLQNVKKNRTFLTKNYLDSLDPVTILIINTKKFVIKFEDLNLA